MAIIINKGICNAKLQGPASSPSLKKTLIQAPAKTYRNVQGYERHNFNLFQTYFKPISNLFPRNENDFADNVSSNTQ